MKKTSICAVFMFISAISHVSAVELGDLPENYPLFSVSDPFAIAIATNAYVIATNNSARITAANTHIAANSNGLVTANVHIANNSNNLISADARILSGSNSVVALDAKLVATSNVLMQTAGISSPAATNISEYVTGIHSNRTDNPHGVTALQTGAVATNDATYLSTVSMADTAWQNPAEAVHWTWTSDGKEITLTDYTGGPTVWVPDMIDGLPVVSFGTIFNAETDEPIVITSISGGSNIKSLDSLAFNYQASLTSVSFKNVTSVGSYAFYQCETLTSVDLPIATSYGSFCFASCFMLHNLYFSVNAPTEQTGVFDGLTANSLTNFITNPTATGWTNYWNGAPVVRMPIEAKEATIGTAIILGNNTTGGTNEAGFFAGNGGGLTNVNASLLDGFTAEELTATGSTYFFTTNLISYGVVTARSASMTPPTEAQVATYTGPVANGQLFGTYLIPSNQMSSVIQTGVYTFNFDGGHTTVPGKNPTIYGELCFVNSGTGVTNQIFTSTNAVVIPYGRAPFQIKVTVTNDVKKDGLAMVLITRMLDNDGYTGDFESHFGPPNYAGFTMPRVSDVFLTKAEFESTPRGATNIIAGVADGYDASTRTLTYVSSGSSIPLAWTPVETVTSASVATVNVTTAKSIYSITASSAITLTNNLASVNLNCGTNYEWEAWINFTSTNALASIVTNWDGRIEWANQTPDLTVTGLYKFAFSTACGTRIQGRQVYPTVYRWMTQPMSVTVSSTTAAYGGSYLLFANTVTNAFILSPHFNESRSCLYKLSFSTSSTVPNTNTCWVTWQTGTYPPGLSTIGANMAGYIMTGSAGLKYSVYAIIPPIVPDATAGAHVRFDFTRAVALGTGAIIIAQPYARHLNELETAVGTNRTAWASAYQF